MDNDSFYPAIITAAKIVGLGEAVLKNIKTLGIELQEKTLHEVANSIRWVNELGEANQSIIGSGSPVGNGPHALSLASQGKAGTAEINLAVDDIAAFAAITAFVSGINFTLVDNLGQSSFLQLVQPEVAKKRLISFGVAPVTWALGSTISETVTVTHSLGRVPILAVASSWAAPSPPGVASYNAFSPTKENFALNGYAPNTNGGFSSSAAWIAIG